LIKAADMLIAATGDTKARADFATWKMIAKLNAPPRCPPKPGLPGQLQGASQRDDGARGD